MCPSVESEPLRHADAFPTGPDAALPACDALPLTDRLEALLLAADRPLSDGRLIDLLNLMPVLPKPRKRRAAASAEPASETQGTDASAAETEEATEDPATAKARKHAVATLKAAIESLNETYASSGRTFRIEPVASGWQILTLPAFGPLLARLRGDRQSTRLSQPALETLAIIAYRQPILRADLESIRGVACGEVLKSLMDRRLVRIVGRAEEVGRPMLYGTTKEFLRVFGIATVSDLPDAKALKP